MRRKVFTSVLIVIAAVILCEGALKYMDVRQAGYDYSDVYTVNGTVIGRTVQMPYGHNVEIIRLDSGEEIELNLGGGKARDQGTRVVLFTSDGKTFSHSDTGLKLGSDPKGTAAFFAGLVPIIAAMIALIWIWVPSNSNNTKEQKI